MPPYKFLAFIFYVIIAFSLCAFAQQSVMFRADPAHTGVYGGTPPTTVATVKWKFKTNARIIGSAAVTNGTVYFGSMDQNFYAVDAETGVQKWKLDFTDRS